MMESTSATTTPAEKALAMLDAFAGVGVNTFDLTITNIKEDERGRQIVVGYDEDQSISELRRRMPHLISDATRKQNNNIVRPHNPPGVTVIQLDDLDAAKVARVVDHSFMVICTSSGNHQAWLAVNDAPSETEAAKDFVRRVKKATGADCDRERRDPHCGRRQFQAQRRARVFTFRDHAYEARPHRELRGAGGGRTCCALRNAAPAPTRL